MLQFLLLFFDKLVRRLPLLFVYSHDMIQLVRGAIRQPVYILIWPQFPSYYDYDVIVQLSTDIIRNSLFNLLAITHHREGQHSVAAFCERRTRRNKSLAKNRKWDNNGQMMKENCREIAELVPEFDNQSCQLALSP